MHVVVRGKQVDVGDALRSYATDRLAELVEKYFDRAIDAQVVVSRDAHTFKVDVSVHPMAGMTVQGTGSAVDAHAAFDAAGERVAKQLRRYKRRITDYKGKGEVLPGRQVVLQPEVPAEADEHTELPAEETAPVVVAEMETHIPVCTVSSAVMRLDLADAPALMFRNSAHGGLNMVYRRRDGNIGWVDPGS